MDVSVIIVNYNTKELIRNCIQSIYDKTQGVEFEIIVVDNNSQDGSQEMIKSEFPEVNLLELSENVGFGRANNEGAKLAEGKYLLLLNSDTLIHNNALKIFLEFYESFHEVYCLGVVGAMLLNDQFEIFHSYGDLPTFYSEINFDIKSIILDLLGRELYAKIKLNFSKEIKLSQKYEMLHEVGYVTGADIFVLRTLFDKYNGFDQGFFMYFEETDLQLKMKSDGLKNFIIQGPIIQHLEAASFKGTQKKINIKRKIFLDKSRFYYFKKNYKFKTYLIYRILHTIISVFYIFDRNFTLKDRVVYICSLFSKKTAFQYSLRK